MHGNRITTPIQAFVRVDSNCTSTEVYSNMQADTWHLYELLLENEEVIYRIKSGLEWFLSQCTRACVNRNPQAEGYVKQFEVQLTDW